MSSTSTVFAMLAWDLRGQCQLLLHRGDTVLVGREEGVDLRLNIPEISRRHAVVSWRGNAFEIQDLGSTNGVLINGERIEKATRLNDGDVIRLYSIDLAYSLVDEVPQEKQGVTQTFVMARSAGQPRLIISAGPQEGRQILLVPGVMQIGRMTARSDHWDIALQDRSVSRPHARIEGSTEGFRLADLGSANGTLVNGREISEATLLNDGDVLHIGETTLIFRAV